MSTGTIAYIVVVVVVCGFFAALYLLWHAHERGEPGEGEMDHKAVVERLLRPNWKFYERHLQRPAPKALRELFADTRLVTSCNLQVTKNDGISAFNPLDEDSLIPADLLAFDIVPFATSDRDVPIFLRPGKDELDKVYIAYHDNPDRGPVVLADSVAAMLESLRRQSAVRDLPGRLA